MPKKFKENIIVTGLLLFCLMISFYDIFFLKKTFKVTTANSQALSYGAYGQENNKPKFIPVNGTDTPVLEEPLYEFIKQNLRKGILPLWNPHQACGYPLVAMIQVGIFFPINFILYLFPQLYAWDIMIIARILLGGLFTYLFMRRIRFKPIPSFTAAIVFMLSGPMLLLQYWTANVDILTPLLFIALENIIAHPKKRNIALLSIIISLTIFAGHPEHIFLVNAYGGAYLLFRLFIYRKIIIIKKVFPAVVISYLLGLTLSSIVLFPFIWHLLFEFWNGHPKGTGLLMEEQRERALTLALPHFFQKEPLTYQWSFSGWWGGYLGTLPLALAFLSLFNKHKKGLNFFFATIAFILVGKQYGLPIINWLGYLPFFNMCRYAIHTPPLTALTIAFLAGMGVRTILLNKKIFLKSLFFSIPLLLIIAIHLIILKSSETFSISLKASFFALSLLLMFQFILFIKDNNWLKRKTIGYILILLTFLELFLYIHREHPYRFNSFPQVPYIEFLKSSPQRARSYGIFWAFYPNTGSGFQVDDLGYFLGLVPKRFISFANQLIIKDHFKKDLRPPALRAIPIQGRKHILDLLNVKYIVAPSSERLSKLLNNFNNIAKTNLPAYSQEVNIYQRNSAYPRAFIVHRAVFEPDKEKSLELINKMGEYLRQIAIINEPAHYDIQAALKNSPIMDSSHAQITKYTVNEIIIDAFLENDGFLILSDSFHPDWEVSVNKKASKIFQTDYLLRSVFLKAGKHEVKFKFRPKSFYLGLWITLLSLGIICFLAFSPQKQRS